MKKISQTHIRGQHIKGARLYTARCSFSRTFVVNSITLDTSEKEAGGLKALASPNPLSEFKTLIYFHSQRICRINRHCFS